MKGSGFGVPQVSCRQHPHLTPGEKVRLGVPYPVDLPLSSHREFPVNGGYGGGRSCVSVLRLLRFRFELESLTML